MYSIIEICLIIKPGVPALDQLVWFLEIVFIHKVSMCVYIPTSQAIENHSHVMKVELPIKQVLLLFSFFI